MTQDISKLQERVGDLELLVERLKAANSILHEKMLRDLNALEEEIKRLKVKVIA